MICGTCTLAIGDINEKKNEVSDLKSELYQLQGRKSNYKENAAIHIVWSLFFKVRHLC